MNRSPEELIEYLETYNRHRSYLKKAMEHGEALYETVDLLKKMTWQPMETAPKDREFLGVWGPKDPPPGEAFDVFIYDEDEQNFTFSHGDAFLPSETCQLFAWMEIPKYNP